MAYDAIPNSDVDADSPITTSLMTRMRDNPLAIAAGDTGAPRVAIDVSSKYAIATDETDTSLVLRPDGFGGVEWESDRPTFVGSTKVATGTNSCQITGIGDEKWLINANGTGGNSPYGLCHGWCIFDFGTITAQSTAYMNDGASAGNVANAFTFSTGTLTFTVSGFISGTTRTCSMSAVRLG